MEIGHVRFNADSEHLVTAVKRALRKAAEQREQRERAAAEIGERQEKEQLGARRREYEEQEQLQLESQSQLSSSVTPLAAPAQPEADKPSGET